VNGRVGPADFNLLSFPTQWSVLRFEEVLQSSRESVGLVEPQPRPLDQALGEPRAISTAMFDLFQHRPRTKDCFPFPWGPPDLFRRWPQWVGLTHSTDDRRMAAYGAMEPFLAVPRRRGAHAP
jgi:hypothetical protein